MTMSMTMAMNVGLAIWRFSAGRDSVESSMDFDNNVA